ncbi:retinoic acid receptor rxr-alpha [Plakobranchus ocellatus]|uniref:Retinoic acid receptor rxr-alpha n=1 Tax=Plakobranchus ocellatus TaxID=259542 RepID=A0AAV4A818_9GAST|nr:retinoic acid receptor rxr-alpha [Plakobranchus ocellatus]
MTGYFKIDIQDRISLGKHVGFGLMVLIACTEFYDPEFKRFRHIWNWVVQMQNPLFSYKVHLLQLGDRVNDLHVDSTEAAMLCAISMTSVDCPDLVKPSTVCVVRDSLVKSLEAYMAGASLTIPLRYSGSPRKCQL